MANVAYKDIADSRILVRTFRGKVTSERILDSWDYIYENGLLKPGHLGVISDYRQADLDLRKEDFEQLDAHYEKYGEIISAKKLAQVIDSPKIAIPVLYQLRDSKKRTRPFSTFEAAVDWILR